MDFFSDIVVIGQYVISIIGILGLIIFIAGLVRGQRELLQRGGYLLILAIVLGVCGYFIYNATIDKAKERLYYMESSLTGDY